MKATEAARGLPRSFGLDCLTHQAFGVPHLEFLPDGGNGQPEWPYRASMAQFA